ncbi:hypothetical protein PMI34_03265, partial [Pseudomonas sp. GM74]
HPCRVAHCAEPTLGLTRGRTPQQRPRRPTGRPGRGFRSPVMPLVGCQAAFAGKPAPTRFCACHMIRVRHITCGSGLAREEAGRFNINIGCQVAIASKSDRHTAAPTEQQKQIGIHPRFSPLIRSSVSSPAAFDLDPPAPSEGLVPAFIRGVGAQRRSAQPNTSRGGRAKPTGGDAPG